MLKGCGVNLFHRHVSLIEKNGSAFKYLVFDVTVGFINIFNFNLKYS